MISVGDIVAGTVVACESFGAFVEHEGVQYFVPMHELSWDRLRHSSDAVSVGERREILVDRTDNSPPGGPLGSLRRVHPELNPWADPTDYFVGTEFTGTLAVKRDFGWVVAHPRGIDGLLHADQIPPDFDADIGDTLSVQITECDVEAQQIWLSLASKTYSMKDHDSVRS